MSTRPSVVCLGPGASAVVDRLADGDWSVVVASGVADAVERASSGGCVVLAFDEDPDHALLERVRSRDDAVPIVVVASSVDPAFADAALEHDVDAVREPTADLDAAVATALHAESDAASRRDVSLANAGRETQPASKSTQGSDPVENATESPAAAGTGEVADSATAAIAGAGDGEAEPRSDEGTAGARTDESVASARTDEGADEADADANHATGADADDRGSDVADSTWGGHIVDRLFETSPDHLVVFEPDGTLVRANDRARETFAVTIDETQAGDVDVYDRDGEYLPPEDRPWTKVFETGEASYGHQFRVHPAEGEPTWYAVDVVPLGGGPDAAFVSLRDVTTEERERERLRERQAELVAELDETLDRVTDAFLALDTQFRITYLNDTAADLIDVDPDAVAGEVLWDVFPEAVGTTFEAEYRRAMTDQRAVGFEEYYPPLSTWFAVRAYPSETGLSIYFQDVTDRKRRERALNERLGRQQILSDLSTDALERADVDAFLRTATERTAETLDADAACLVEYGDGEAAGGVRVRASVGEFDGLEDTVEGGLIAAPPTPTNDAPGTPDHGDATDEADDATDEADDATDEAGDATDEAGDASPEVDEAGETDHITAEVDDDAEVDEVDDATTVMRDETGVVVTADVGATDDPWGALIVRVCEPEALPPHDRRFVRSVANVMASAIDRRRRERALETKNERLAALDQLSRVVRDINRELSGHSSREEIERVVCERLANASSYASAWIGDVDDDGQLYVRTEAGVEDVLERRDLSLAADEVTAPALTALQDRTLTAAQDVRTDPVDENWRAHADRHGYQSSISVPLVQEDETHGVLTIYADRVHAFDGRERRVVEQLGEVVGLAIALAERDRELRERERQYRTLAENVPNASVSMFDADGAYVTVAGSLFENALDVSTDALVGATPDGVDAFPESVRDALADVHDAAIAGERAETEIDAADRTFFARALPLPDATDSTGGVAAGIALVQDVTERHQHREQLEHERERLEYVNRLLRHNLLNSLNVANARANLLDGHVDDAVEPHLETATDRLGEMIDFVETMRSLMHILVDDTHEREPISLDGVLTDEIEKLDASYDVDVASTDLPGVAVAADDLLPEVFENLLVNAVQHNDAEEPAVTVSADVVRSAGEVTVYVADNGPGVPDEMLDDLFQKGEKGFDSPGTGFGLYLVRETVDAYGGEVALVDGDTDGATFAVTLPLADADTATAEGAADQSDDRDTDGEYDDTSLP